MMINTDIGLYSDDEDSMPNIITPPNFRRRLSIKNIIGDYNNSSEAKILFNCNNNEQIDLLQP